jgi:hypothetical protein
MITAIPASGTNFTFKEWEIVEGAITDLDLNANPAMFTMPAGGVKIMAHFQGSGIGNGMNAIVSVVAYPNPTSGVLHIARGHAPLSVEIYDAAGRLVFRKTLSTLRTLSTMSTESSKSSMSTETTIDISHLQNGVYYLKTGNEVVKIVKK